MIKSFFKKISISRHIILISFVFAALSGVILLYSGQKIYSKISSSLLYEESINAEKTFLDAVDYSSYLMNYLGLQIRDEIGYRNFDGISKLFSSFKLSANSRVPWNMFSWVNSNFNLIINSSFGIVRPVSVIDRKYAKLSVLKPWEIHMDNASLGKMSKELIIPCGMGIASKSGKYLGAIVFGLNIEKLINKISQSLGDKKVEFAIFDANSAKFVGQSRGFFTDEDFLESAQKAISSGQKNGVIGSFLFFSSNKGYAVYKKIGSYDYYVVTKHGSEFSKSEFFLKGLPYLIEVLMLFVVILVFMLLLNKLIIRPIIQLSYSSELITQNRDNEIKLPKTFILEISNLAEQISNISNYKIALIQAKKSQERFFANMNHELRTPLNGILNFSVMMKQKMLGPLSDEYQEMASDIHCSGKHLLNLINDILDFSKMDLGKFRVCEEWFNISCEVKEAIKIATSDILLDCNFPVKITSNIDPSITKIRFDRRMFKQILLNLLSNSMKFTEKGEIKLHAFIDGEFFVLKVSDSGIGIKEEDLEKLVVEFGQVGDGFSRGKRQGSGLGLFLVKKMVELHSGEFKLESIYGHGTTVTMRFLKNRTQYDQ